MPEPKPTYLSPQQDKIRIAADRLLTLLDDVVVETDIPLWVVTEAHRALHNLGVMAHTIKTEDRESV